MHIGASGVGQLLDDPGACHELAAHISQADRPVHLGDHVIAPVVAGIWKPMGRPPNTYTRIERDYDTLRADLRILFNDPSSTAAQTTNLSIRKRKLTRNFDGTLVVTPAPSW